MVVIMILLNHGHFEEFSFFQYQLQSAGGMYFHRFLSVFIHTPCTYITHSISFFPANIQINFPYEATFWFLQFLMFRSPNFLGVHTLSMQQRPFSFVLLNYPKGSFDFVYPLLSGCYEAIQTQIPKVVNEE